MPDTQQKDVKKPKLGEETKVQAIGAISTVFWSEIAGFQPTPAGSYAVYRKMRTNPTIAMARAAATAPIKASSFSMEADEGVPEERVSWLQKQMERLWPDLVRHVLYALDFGFQAFEKVWAVEKGRLIIRKMKPLKPEITRPLVDKETGGFNGLRQKGVDLGPDKCWWFRYDAEPGYWFGRPRHENIREHAWNPWNELARRLGQYVTKIAGVVPVIEYPLGESRNKDGDIKSNFELATAILDSLGKGKGVAMPNVYSEHAGDLHRAGVDLSKLKAWHIEFLESKGRHGGDLITMMKHFETLMVRGWLVPERAITEGQHGTKAEAEEHANIALTIADLLLQDIIRDLNEYLVRPILRYNFGIEAERGIRMRRAGLDPKVRRFFMEMIKGVLGVPVNAALFMRLLDVDAMLDEVGLPKNEEEDEEEGVPQPPVVPSEEEDGNPPPPTPNAASLVQKLYGNLNDGS